MNQQEEDEGPGFLLEPTAGRDSPRHTHPAAHRARTANTHLLTRSLLCHFPQYEGYYSGKGTMKRPTGLALKQAFATGHFPLKSQTCGAQPRRHHQQHRNLPRLPAKNQLVNLFFTAFAPQARPLPQARAAADASAQLARQHLLRDPKPAHYGFAELGCPTVTRAKDTRGLSVSADSTQPQF